MNTAKRLLLAVSLSGLVIVLLVLSRVGGALASIVPPEVLLAFAAIAALVGYALHELRRGAPRGISHSRHTRQLRGDLTPEKTQIVQVCRSTEDRAAA